MRDCGAFLLFMDNKALMSCTHAYSSIKSITEHFPFQSQMKVSLLVLMAASSATAFMPAASFVPGKVSAMTRPALRTCKFTALGVF